MSADLSAPPPDDVTQPWWDATSDHRLLVQHCDACGAYQHPPRALCVSCARTDALGFLEAEGLASVDTWTVVHRSPEPVPEPPYVVARVVLAEGPILLTRLVGDPVGELWSIGDALALAWVNLDDVRALPVFRAAIS